MISQLGLIFPAGAGSRGDGECQYNTSPLIKCADLISGHRANTITTHKVTAICIYISPFIFSVCRNMSRLSSYLIVGGDAEYLWVISPGNLILAQSWPQWKSINTRPAAECRGEQVCKDIFRRNAEFVRCRYRRESSEQSPLQHHPMHAYSLCSVTSLLDPGQSRAGSSAALRSIWQAVTGAPPS